MNQVVLVGKIADDVTILKIGDYEVATTRISIQSDYKNSEGKYIISEYPVLFWDPLKQFALDYLKKNIFVSIRGHLRVFEYVTEEGERKSILDIIADKVNFVTSQAA